jgi:hypothetical protein
VEGNYGIWARGTGDVSNWAENSGGKLWKKLRCNKNCTVRRRRRRRGRRNEKGVNQKMMFLSEIRFKRKIR